LEFYFPQYSSKEAQERIKNLLKDPTFDRNSDKNIAKILDIVKISGKGKSLGDERSQIKATILSCIDSAELNDFFKESDDRKNFLTTSKKVKV
jgi:predicted nucleic acid-binding protein